MRKPRHSALFYTSGEDERIGNVRAIGPILQGLNRPANDLARDCNRDDVYASIAVTVVQAQDAHNRQQS